MQTTRSETTCAATVEVFSAVPASFARPASGPTVPSRDLSLAKALGKTKRTIRLVLADDHPVVRKGISAMLSRCPHLEVVGEAGDGQEALRLAKELLPDIVLTDLEMPRLSGLGVTEALQKELPQIKVLILSMFSNTDFVMRIMQAGAKGYILKGAPSEELIQAIETVEAGDCYFSPDVARVALNQYVCGSGGKKPAVRQLTARERQVLTEIARGFTNKEIGLRLGVGVRTIETHRERIMRKLDIRGVASLTRYAIAHGLVMVRE
jgi:DNA-binding NarL/FixJ family response regulator